MSETIEELLFRNWNEVFESNGLMDDIIETKCDG